MTEAFSLCYHGVSISFFSTCDKLIIDVYIFMYRLTRETSSGLGMCGSVTNFIVTSGGLKKPPLRPLAAQMKN